MSTELMTGFIIWLAGGGLLTAVGIGAFFSKKEVGFFCNVKPLPMRGGEAVHRVRDRLRGSGASDAGGPELRPDSDLRIGSGGGEHRGHGGVHPGDPEEIREEIGTFGESGERLI